MGPIHFITAGLGFGQKHAGVELGPAAWLQFFMKYYPSLLVQRPETQLIREVHRYVPVSSDASFQKIASYYEKLADSVEHSQLMGHTSVNLGGDHSIGLATVRGSLAVHGPALRVLWVDAHGDINTPGTSPTGSFHGMPVSHLLGLWDRSSRRPILPPQNLVLFGVRDLDSGERRLIEKHNIKVFTADEVRERGFEFALRSALRYLRADQNPLHVSFDVDVLDPLVFPQTGVPVEHGFCARECEAFFNHLASVPHLVALDLVEFNPRLQPTADVSPALRIIGDFLLQLQIQHKRRCNRASGFQLPALLG